MPHRNSPPRPNVLLRRAREARGWSQEHLAEVLGTNAFTISRWERGHAVPRPYFRQQLCTLLGLSPEALGLLTPQKPPVPPEESLPARPAGVPVATLAAPLLVPLLPPRPGPTTGVVGRAKLLAQLKGRLLSGEPQASWALQGLPGVGKTALALELAHDPDVQAAYPDGICWAGLGLHPQIPDILGRWGSALGLGASDMTRLTSLAAWAETLRQAIGTRRLLLILDDAWRIEDALACQVGGPNTTHLLTTRSAELALQFAGAGITPIPELDLADGVELLAQLAPHVVAAEPAAAERLVQAMGGLPLGLVLLGKYLYLQSFHAQPRRVQVALARLQERALRLKLAQPQAPGQAHPSLPASTPLSLQASIALSVEALPPEAQVMLGALALFPPKPTTFAEEAALAVAERPAEVLDTLVDTGLVESAGAGRYRLHQTIADFARLQLPQQDAKPRFISYSVTWLAAHARDETALTQELENLLAALQYAQEEGQQAELVQGLVALAPFLLDRGLYDTVQAWLPSVQQAAEFLGDHLNLAALALYQGRLLDARGNHAQAATILEEGLRLVRQSDAPALLCDLLLRVGIIAEKTKRAAYAEACYQEGIRLAEALDDPARLGPLLNGLGALLGRQGDFVRAAAAFEAAVPLARQSQDFYHLCLLFVNLGLAVSNLGNHERAEHQFQAALSVAREHHYPLAQVMALAQLAERALRLGQIEAARPYVEEGLVLVRQLGSRERLANFLRLQGMVALAAGELDQAEGALREGLALARDLQVGWVLSVVLLSWGEVQLARQQAEPAAAAFQEVLELEAQRQSSSYGEALFGLAQVAAMREDWVQAQSQAEASLALFERSGYYRAAEVQTWLVQLSQTAPRARSGEALTERAQRNGTFQHHPKPE